MRSLYAVYDAKAEGFLNPVSFPSTGIAIRWFSALLLDEENEVSKFAEDFHLMEIGKYHEKTGKLESLETPRSITSALALKAALVKERSNG